MVSTLEADGFEVSPDHYLCNVPGCAAFEWWPDRLGGIGYSVSWSVDQDGQIRRIQAEQVSLLN